MGLGDRALLPLAQRPRRLLELIQGIYYTLEQELVKSSDKVDKSWFPHHIYHDPDS